MSGKIYLADDEPAMRDVLSQFLIKDDFQVDSFDNGNDLVNACEKETPDAVVLDVVLPGMDGLSACSKLRSSYPKLPIILISVKGSPYDRVTGLMIGADDYICKPFLHIELTTRVQAILRRAQEMQEMKKPEQVSSFGSLALHLDKHTATLNGENFPLTPNEFDFLAFLIRKDGAAASREELISHLWKVEWQDDTRVADDLVKRLRKKLRDRDSDVTIKTVWGYGFRLSLNPQR